MPTALVTGTTRGLGKALAGRLRTDGWDVRSLDRRQVDLSDHAAIPAALRSALEGVGRLDLALLSAGVLGEFRDLKDTPMAEVRRVMDVNVWANKVLVDALMASGIPVGHVVGISSGAAKLGSGGMGPYSISKAALNLLLLVYAAEHPGTHFTALAPGVIRTDMIERTLAVPDNPRWPAVARIRSAAGTDRMQTPEAAAARVIGGLPELRKTPSGAFVDVREL